MIALSVLSVSDQICGLEVKAYSLFIKWSDCIDFSRVGSRDAVIQMVVVNLTQAIYFSWNSPPLLHVAVLEGHCCPCNRIIMGSARCFSSTKTKCGDQTMQDYESGST